MIDRYHEWMERHVLRAELGSRSSHLIALAGVYLLPSVVILLAVAAVFLALDWLLGMVM